MHTLSAMHTAMRAKSKRQTPMAKAPAKVRSAPNNSDRQYASVRRQK
jgi:hypothetical protein